MIHRKLKIEKHQPHKTLGCSSCKQNKLFETFKLIFCYTFVYNIYSVLSINNARFLLTFWIIFIPNNLEEEFEDTKLGVIKIRKSKNDQKKKDKQHLQTIHIKLKIE
jgi:hypothetical protein